MNLQSVFLIGVGGFVGTLARYSIGVALVALGARPFWSTLAVNILGSFVMGWVLAGGSEKWSQSTILVLTVGLLGGFTTFSAFSADAILLLQLGENLSALFYVTSMLILGILSAYLGFILGSPT